MHTFIKISNRDAGGLPMFTKNLKKKMNRYYRNLNNYAFLGLVLLARFKCIPLSAAVVITVILLKKLHTYIYLL